MSQNRSAPVLFSAAFGSLLTNRRALSTELGLPENIGDADLLHAAWRRWGDGLGKHLEGDFAYALSDRDTAESLLIRDPLGSRPLYYRLDGGRLRHGFSLAQLRAGSSPDPDWVARYLLGLSWDHRLTAYREIRKLPPGHCLGVDASGRVREWAYHSWRDDAPWASRRDPRWVEAYRERLEAAVHNRMGTGVPIGTENSGGLDSASVTCLLARHLAAPAQSLHSFGFALCEQEPAYIGATNDAAGIAHRHVVTELAPERDDDETTARCLDVLGYPEEHANASLHLPFYLACQAQGITSLFSGFGGDEVATNPGHLLRFELLDRHCYRTLWDQLPGNPLRRSLRLGKQLALGWRSPAYKREFLASWRRRWPHFLLRDEFVESQNLQQAYFETARYDAPYRRINDFIVEHLLQAPYVATRMENCSVMAAAHGVVYRWPLLDASLIQQYLSTPAIEKQGPGGIGRYLHRRAVAGMVPERVAWKPSKDMGYAELDAHQEPRLRRLAEQARAHEANLHPLLEELIDREKWRAQIARIRSGAKIDSAFAFQFKRNAKALAWLNLWIKGC